MNVIKIVVDKLPENCIDCHLNHRESYGGVNVGQDEFYVCEAMEQIIDERIFKPSWCPLVVEDECVWKHKFYDTYKPDCKDSIVSQSSYIYCPNCGKRIKRIRYEDQP